MLKKKPLKNISDRLFTLRKGGPLAIAAALFAMGAALPGTLQSDEATTTTRTEQPEVLKETSQAFNQVAKNVSPAVVSISAVKKVDPMAAQLGAPFGGLDPFGGDQMPGQIPGEEQSFGMGSGVIISADGTIITNNHVVSEAEKVTVELKDRKEELSASVIGTDPNTDLAIIKLDKKIDDLPVAKLGDSDKVEVGDWAVAIGSPFGLSHTVTSGIISAVGRAEMGVFDTEDFIQSDVAINPGNSGGPLLNLEGEVIGINAAIFSQNGGFIGIGFSIPANMAKEVSRQIIEDGRVVRGWIGVLAQDVNPELGEYFKVPQKKGALISHVTKGGPAHSGKIQVGDVIVGYSDSKIESSDDLKKAVAKTKVGKTVPVEIIRKGDEKKINLAIIEQPLSPDQIQLQQKQQAGKVADPKKDEKPTYGLAVDDIPPEFEPLIGVGKDGGVMVVDVLPGSLAFDAGLTPGDVILKANNKSISTSAEFNAFMKKLKKKDLAVFYVQRGPDDRFFASLKHQG